MSQEALGPLPLALSKHFLRLWTAAHTPSTLLRAEHFNLPQGKAGCAETEIKKSLGRRTRLSGVADGTSPHSSPTPYCQTHKCWPRCAAGPPLGWVSAP